MRIFLSRRNWERSMDAELRFHLDDIFSVETILPRQDGFLSLPMRIQGYLAWRTANTAFESLGAHMAPPARCVCGR
jgi:hypothetical protein